jgi:hypothetical protein
MLIKIYTQDDHHDCETCGCSYSYGGIVYADNNLVLERNPHAFCFGSPTFEPSDLLVMALKKLGITVLVDDEPYQVCSHDDEYHGFELGSQ